MNPNDYEKKSIKYNTKLTNAILTNNLDKATIYNKKYTQYTNLLIQSGGNTKESCEKQTCDKQTK